MQHFVMIVHYTNTRIFSLKLIRGDGAKITARMTLLRASPPPESIIPIITSVQLSRIIVVAILIQTDALSPIRVITIITSITIYIHCHCKSHPHVNVVE